MTDTRPPTDADTTHTSEARETRARRRIRQAIESRGHVLDELEWEPWSLGGEKEGMLGGWSGATVEDFMPNTTPGNEFYGYDVEECLAHIDWAIEPPEPCACERPRFHSPLSNIRGALEIGMHDESCRWFIRYRLKHWSRSERNEAQR